MRTTIYGLLNKTTGRIEYTNYYREKVVEKMNSLENKDSYEIRYTWRSF